MVKDIEKLGAKLNRALFAWPREGYCLRNGKVEVCLSRTIYDPRSAVSKRCPNAIRADYGRRRDALK